MSELVAAAENSSQVPQGRGIDDNDDDGGEEKLCRFCFEEGDEENPLLSPCNCSGGQKYIHLNCLRKWQRINIVSQPTHPAFWKDDVRHHKCNVCTATFTCPPPSRHELMTSFTGPEIAGMIDTGFVIGAHRIFSEEMNKELTEYPEVMHERLGLSHWIRGCYLIYDCIVDDGLVPLKVSLPSSIDSIDANIELEGKRYNLCDESHSELEIVNILAGMTSPDQTSEDFVTLLQTAREQKLLTYPFFIIYKAEEVSCGDDHIQAVNLTKPKTPSELMHKQVLNARKLAGKKTNNVKVNHYIGGPCDTSSIRNCIVSGGNSRGWSNFRTLSDALKVAASRAANVAQTESGCEESSFFAGCKVEVHGLNNRADLNGELGVTLRYIKNEGRWNVRLRAGDGVQIKPVNLRKVDKGGDGGTVDVFWGDARWTRTQLLGEISRGE